MIKKGIVIATEGNVATIEELKDIYCLDCINRGDNHNCLNCKKRAQDTVDRHISVNVVGAEIGDLVEYSKNLIANVISNLVIFALPIFLMIVSYILINVITANDQLSGRIALSVLAVSMICAAVYSYKISKTRCEFKIISKI